MTTARDIIRGTLSFHLNRLSPGEQEDADLFGRCLLALNFIADELNGHKSFLWREILTASSAITGATGTLGTTWTGLVSGDQILGATIRYSSTLDVPLDPITMAQYANIGIKTQAGIPAVYAHDGAATVYLYPVAASHVITLRTKQAMTDFADLDTDYSMPKGYKAGLSALLAERMAPSLIGSISPAVAKAASAAKTALLAQGLVPAILNPGDGVGRVARIQRGY